ncbi:MAG: hypothetical protein LBH10_04455, partial [Burkholderiaceae bacterium]|nr:hypothetical protein [Burkholderiaceae bacterium]
MNRTITIAVVNALPDAARSPLGRRIVRIYVFLALFNAAAWIWAFVAFRHYPLLMGTSLLAYTFGLR